MYYAKNMRVSETLQYLPIKQDVGKTGVVRQRQDRAFCGGRQVDQRILASSYIMPASGLLKSLYWGGRGHNRCALWLYGVAGKVFYIRGLNVPTCLLCVLLLVFFFGKR